MDKSSPSSGTSTSDVTTVLPIKITPTKRENPRSEPPSPSFRDSRHLSDSASSDISSHSVTGMGSDDSTLPVFALSSNRRESCSLSNSKNELFDHNTVGPTESGDLKVKKENLHKKSSSSLLSTQSGEFSRKFGKVIKDKKAFKLMKNDYDSLILDYRELEVENSQLKIKLKMLEEQNLALTNQLYQAKQRNDFGLPVINRISPLSSPFTGSQTGSHSELESYEGSSGRADSLENSFSMSHESVGQSTSLSMSEGLSPTRSKTHRLHSFISTSSPKVDKYNKLSTGESSSGTRSLRESSRARSRDNLERKKRQSKKMFSSFKSSDDDHTKSINTAVVCLNSKFSLETIRNVIDLKFGKEMAYLALANATSFVPNPEKISPKYFESFPPFFERVTDSDDPTHDYTLEQKARAMNLYIAEEHIITTPIYFSKVTKDCLYSKIFKPINHVIFLFKYEDFNFVLCVTPTHPCKALLFTHVFPMDVKDFKIDTIKKFLLQSSLFFKPVQVLSVIPSTVTAIVTSMSEFERNYHYSISPMQIGVIYLKKDQTLIQALENDQFNMGSCAKFSSFASSIGCEDFEESDVFNDVFQDVKIKWYLSTTMSADAVRRYIGNSPIIVLYMDYCEPFSIESFLAAGKVTQLAFIVQELPEKRDNQHVYRVGILHKIPNFDFEFPKTYIFDAEELRSFLLITSCYAMVAIKEESALCPLYSMPRYNELEKLAFDFKKFHTEKS